MADPTWIGTSPARRAELLQLLAGLLGNVDVDLLSLQEDPEAAAGIVAIAVNVQTALDVACAGG